jgi:hypothetical protein
MPATRDDQIRALEHPEMLHHRATVQVVEVAAELAGRPRGRAQQVEDLPSRRMPERAEDPVLLVQPP